MRLFITTLILLVAVVQTQADDRLPIPDKAAQEKADALIQEVFGDEIKAATKPDAKLALTKKLLEESATADTSPSGRYAMLKAALDVSPDAQVAMSVIDNMAKHFQLDVLRAKAVTIRGMAEFAIRTSERQALAELAIELSDLYLEQDNFMAASALIDIALDAATKSRDSQLIRGVRAKKDDVSSSEKKYADVKLALATLETDPTEAKSNSIVGTYKCLVKGAWEDGLPMLALADDETLKELATKELMGAKASNEQVSLADGWYGVAQESDDASNEQMLQRAGFWYRKSLASDPALSRLVKAKVEKRLEQIQATRWNSTTAVPPRSVPARTAKRTPTTTRITAHVWEVTASQGQHFKKALRTDGTFAGGTWSRSGNRIVVRWKKGWVDKLTISGDGRTMTGSNQYGNKSVWRLADVATTQE